MGQVQKGVGPDLATLKGQSDSVTRRLRQVESEIQSLEQERDALASLKRGIDGLLQLHGPIRQSSSGKPVGQRSLRGAAIEVVQEARGQPLSTAEILERSRRKGADSKAKDPSGVIDLMLYTVKKRKGLPLERLPGGRWRWVG
jgi:hypothetical protein